MAHGHDHGHEHGHQHGHEHTHDGEVYDQAYWDARYAGDKDGAPMWSGEPNGTLVVEVAAMAPGTALDVGCGEGADAIWLAGQGWQVTAVEPSGVALDRARDAADQAGVEVTWVHAGLLDMPGGTGTHDLVSAQYPAVPKADGAALDALLGAVAPGGTLLFVHHDSFAEHGHEHGIDVSQFVGPDDVVAALGNGWAVEVNEVRPRPGPLPPDARHVKDVVVRARRVS